MMTLWMRSFGVIWIMISDPRSFTWFIKGTDESVTREDYIPKTILEMRQSILCFKEIVMRSDSWSVLFRRDSHLITYF